MAHYSVEQLEIKDISEEEFFRTEKIYEDLKSKAKKGNLLLERQKEFLCISLKLSINQKDGGLKKFEVCNDFIFKELFLTYFRNNLNEPFYKSKFGKIVEVTEKEKFIDLKILQKISDKWLEEIKFEKHTDLILQELAAETRKELKELEKKYPRLLRNFKKKQNDYRLQKDKIILQSKFIYLLTKRVKEDFNQEDFEIPFDGQILEFTSYSLIHIANRHYAEAIKNRDDKTYHYKNFLPDELHLNLKKILTEIDNEKLIDISKTNNIIFIYEEVVYHLWIEKKIKQIKGVGNVQFNQIQTFYPIYDAEKLEEINLLYKSHIISPQLSVYIC